MKTVLVAKSADLDLATEKLDRVESEHNMSVFKQRGEEMVKPRAELSLLQWTEGLAASLPSSATTGQVERGEEPASPTPTQVLATRATLPQQRRLAVATREDVNIGTTVASEEEGNLGYQTPPRKQHRTKEDDSLESICSRSPPLSKRHRRVHGEKSHCSPRGSERHLSRGDREKQGC